MPVSPQYRIADASDLPALYQLARAALPTEDFSLALFTEKLTHRPWPGPAEMQTLLAEVERRPVGFMQTIVRPAVHRAWLGLFAVAAPYRRQGIATELWRRVQPALPTEFERLEVLALPANTFTPGIDARNDVAIRFVESLGFEHFDDCCNLRVDLAQSFDGSAAERELAARGITVRRATPADDGVLDAFFEQHFGPGWHCEAKLALTHDQPPLHLALRDDRLISFSAHSVQNREWGYFGPIGTAPEARGAGIGRALLWRCLNDMRAAGHASAVIPWVGPVPFYERWANAWVERAFRRYRLEPGGKGP